MTDQPDSGRRDASLLVAGRFVTMLGTGMAPVCLVAAGLRYPGIGVGGLGLAVGAVGVGQLAFTLLAGALADRAGARAAMICGDILAFLAQAGMAALFMLRVAGPLSVAVLSFLLGVGSALSGPAGSALVRQICRDDELVAVSSRIRVASITARVLGAPVGGFIAAAGRPYTGLYVDAVTFLCSAVLLSLVAAGRIAGRVSWRPGSALRDIGRGWSAFRAMEWLMPAAIGAAVVNAARAVAQVLIPAALILDGYGPRVWGVVFGIQMAGTVAGLRVAAKWKSQHALAISFLAVTVVGMFLLSVALRAPIAIIAVLALVAGGSISNFGFRVELMIQQTAPQELISRLVAVLSMFSLGLAPVASVTLALLLDAAGRRGALAIWGAAAILAVLAGGLTRAVRRSSEPTDEERTVAAATQ